MPTLLRVYTNEDDALLFWATTAHIDNCRGFAIERKITRRGQQVEDRGFLPNRIGFAKDQPQPDSQGKGPSEPSTVWPFQRFSWTDHDANAGDTVSYRIVPIVRDGSGKLVRHEIDASAFSDARTLGTVPTGSKYRPFFNRGFVMSQFMARYLAQNNLTLKQFKTQIGKPAGKTAEHTIRNFLAGGLRTKILDILATAAAEKTEVYAALFELSDDELVAGLVKLGKRAHVVLANGSIQPKKGEKSAEARKRDENNRARAALIKAKVDVQPKNRFISPGALGHNKFLVVANAQGKAVRAWTGSTNWAPTGLCTQVNNGLLIDDPAIAKFYLDQWHRLRKAASDFPDDLVASNSQAHQSGNATVWFTRAKKQVDLAAINAEVAKAKQGILFLMFMPGATGVLGNVMKRAQEPGLWVRGVVSELPNGHNDESEADVHLVNGPDATQLHLDIIEPEGVKHPMANFAAEVTRTQFLSQVGHAIIHSKVLVIDPFGDDPVVITGSHNFSTSASTKNDENLIIVRGDKALAEAYAVNIEGAYQHYRWRAYLDQTDKPFGGLVDNDTWQDRKLAGARKELDFWGVGLGHVV
jgi:phosphatidylserine/phosphatidylglycerophosphate/cardiolipin synthase-like enzyme